MFVFTLSEESYFVRGRSVVGEKSLVLLRCVLSICFRIGQEQAMSVGSMNIGFFGIS